MITPYGTTVFKIRGTSDSFMGSAPVSRAIEVNDPAGNKELYLYRDSTAALPDNYTGIGAPTNSPIGTLPAGLLQWRNSFHWTPLQYTKVLRRTETGLSLD